MNRVLIVGNVAGGKSALARKLSDRLGLPVFHIDSIQFLTGMQIRPLKETRELLHEITEQERWIVDGFGPLDLLERHFSLADKIVFVDLPLPRHYWWLTKRQVQGIWNPRSELPEGCNEATWPHTVRLFKTTWRIHRRMRPELLRIFRRRELSEKVIWVRSLREWDRVATNGLGP